MILPITPDQLTTIDVAARFLRTLSAVERAHLLGDTDEVEAILGGVDPEDVRQCAETLTAVHRLWELLLLNRGGSIGVADEDGSARRRPEPLSPDNHVSEADAHAPQPTAPHIRLVKRSDNWHLPCV